MENERLSLVTSMYENNPNDSYLAYAAAKEYQNVGDRDKAISIIETLIKNDPEYVDAYFKLGSMYQNSNNITKAVDTYHAGKKVATKKNDQKSLGELTEALMLLDEQEGNW